MINIVLKKTQRLAIIFLPFLFLILFLFLPVSFTILLSFININTGLFTFQNYGNVLNDPLNQYFIYWTFYESIMTTILAVILGLGISYILSHYYIPEKRLIRNLLTVPFLLPSITVLIGFIAIYGRAVYSSNGIILANLFYNLPLMIRLTELGWMSINPEYELVSKSLSMNRFSYFLHVELPSLLPSILTASLLVFIYSFNNFAIVVILGGIQYQTLEVRIYSLFFSLEFNKASALAIISLLINIGVIVAYLHYSSKYKTNTFQYTYESQELQKFRKYNLKGKILRYILLLVYTLVVFIICVYPLIAIFQKSLVSNNKISIANFQSLFSHIIQPYGLTAQEMIYNSLFFATIVFIGSIILSLLLNIGLNYKTSSKEMPVLNLKYIANIIVILPLMVSTITLVYSIFSLYKNTFVYNDVTLIIIISHILIAFPFANRVIASARESINQEMMDVGKSLGLNRRMLFMKIELPLLASSIIVAGIFSFAISIGEFASTYFISRGPTATIPLGIYSLISHRNIPEASALSVILILVTLFIFYFIERFSKFDIRI